MERQRTTPPGYLDKYAAAEKIGISEDYLRRLVREGKITATKSGNRYIFAAYALDEYLSGTRSQTRPDGDALPTPALEMREEIAALRQVVNALREDIAALRSAIESKP